MEPTEPTTPESARHGVPRVLVVDDEVEHAEICAALLRRRGYKVAVALSGEDAIELAQTLQPDLILLDVCMPAVDGVETAVTLHRQAATRNVPIVFLSACGEELERGHAEIGAAAYLAKPFRAAELVACVERSLQRSGR